MTTLRRWVAVTALIAATLAGCGDAGSTKAGGAGPPVTLRIGTNSQPGRPAADQIEEFARQVEDLSDGRLRIEPVWGAGDGDEAWDQVVARKVVSGELDMGSIPARAWDSEGVNSFRALHAPFLVTSDQLLAEIVTGDLASDMLSGLGTIGVTGLALLPEGLRHLFVFGEPPVARDDFEGRVVRAPLSETTYALFEALSATPLPLDGDTFEQAIDDPSLLGAEASFALAGTLPGPTTAIGNLTFFPKANALVVNADAFDELSDEHRSILQNAARRTLDWSVATTRPDADLAREYCSNGGRVVTIDDAEIETLQQAVQPVYDHLERDLATGAMIDRIRQLREGLDSAPSVVAACTRETADGGSEGETETVFPEGVYRADVTAESLIDAGVDRPTAFEHAGIVTLEFRDGRLLPEAECPGTTYSVETARLTIHMGDAGPGCGTAAGLVLFSARWTLEGDQLRFIDVHSGHGSDLLIETLFGGQPFTKIG